MAILSEIIGILVGGISGIATGVGSGLSELASAIFLADGASGQSLSVMGTLIVCFAGIGLAIGLCKLVFHWLTSLGARN